MLGAASRHSERIPSLEVRSLRGEAGFSSYPQDQRWIHIVYLCQSGHCVVVLIEVCLISCGHLPRSSGMRLTDQHMAAVYGHPVGALVLLV